MNNNEELVKKLQTLNKENWLDWLSWTEKVEYVWESNLMRNFLIAFVVFVVIMIYKNHQSEYYNRTNTIKRGIEQELIKEKAQDEKDMKLYNDNISSFCSKTNNC